MKLFRKPAAWWLVALCLYLGASVYLVTSTDAAPTPISGKSKVVLLGFDGVDYKIASRFIREGHLPNLKKLKENGTFTTLDTANPAQSPVAWASIVTGTNPGKTNIGGFIRRRFVGDSVIPDLATTEDNYEGEKHTEPYSQFHWLNHESKQKWIGIFAGGLFLVGLIVLKGILHLGFIFSLVGSLILGGAGVFFGFSFFNFLPENVPYPYNRQQGDTLWEMLARNRVRSVGLYAPGAYPVVAPEASDILGGLGNPDITGSTGTWYVYSSEAFTFFDMDTNTGGKVIRLNDEGGLLTGKIYGPTNFYQIEQYTKQIDALKKQSGDASLKAGDQEKVDDKLTRLEDEYAAWRDDGKASTLDLKIKPNFSNKSIQLEIAGQTASVMEGRWSEWFEVDFQLSPVLKIPALVRLRLIKCAEDEVRFFVPPIDISPKSPPAFLPLSSPCEFCGDMAKRVGLYETVGWACITHGLKDEEISEEVFMEEVEFTLRKRSKLFRDQLAREDWDMFMEVFYTTDRVQHMMYRLFDERHPQYNPQLAEKTISFFGKNIKMGDSILETYVAMDNIIGEVLERIEKGVLPKDTVLMVVSDHGFGPFYYSMGVNNFLVEKDFLVPKPDEGGEPRTIKSIAANDQGMPLWYVDWTKSKAYSMGLGKIYINLKGREPQGIVEPEDYDKVLDEIIEELEAYTDPNTGDRVVKKVYKREEIFSGDFWKEGDTEFQFYRPDGEKFMEDRYTEGFADLYIGFYPKYRVSWQTSLGGVEEETIVPNEQKWSGDHVSVDPSEVPGVFISNKKLRGTSPPNLLDIVPTILSLFKVKVPEKIDGQPISLEL